MASLTIPFRWIIPGLLLAGLLSFPHCSKEIDEIPLPNGNRDTLIVKTIGSSGGIIQLDSVTITIPAGAFSGDQTLEISVS